MDRPPSGNPRAGNPQVEELPSGELPEVVLEIDEQPFRWSDYRAEDFVAFAVFWLLGFVVFLQFFTRYVLNDSLAWTEEVARYLLIAVTFLGGGLAVRRRANIAVEFFHRYLPRRFSNLVLLLCDLITVAFFGYAAVLSWRMTSLMGTQQMSVIDLPMSVLYVAVLAGLVVMTLRAVQTAWARVRSTRTS